MSDVQRNHEDPLRSRAIMILKKRRDFRAHLLIYVLVNASLTMVWAVGDRDTFFWPVFFIVFWGIGVVMNAWDAYVAADFSEEKIQHQIHRLQGGH
jgi:predicted membrane channel-forming protein YqfA (hemolysin III family)